MYNKVRKINKQNQENNVELYNVHNRFDVFVKNIETGEEQECFAENTVTNIAWQDIIFKRECNVLRLGSSSTPEDPTQNNLLSVFATGINPTATSYAYHGLDGNKRTSTFFIGVSQYNGNTIAELGLTNSTSYANVLNRAILKDINGNPITIEKTDVIEVTFYVTIYVTINLQPWQALMSNSCLFNLIKAGNQGFIAYTLTDVTKKVGGTYSIEPGLLKIITARQQPEDLNKGICTLESFGISQDLIRSPILYDVVNQPLGTGNDVLTDFYCGYHMREMTVYKNGVAVSPSEYTFNPNACGPTVADNYYTAMHLFVDLNNKKINNGGPGNKYQYVNGGQSFTYIGSLSNGALISRVWSKGGGGLYATSYVAVDVSDDGSSWTQVLGASASEQTKVLDTPSKYVRFRLTGAGATSSGNGCYFNVFTSGTGQIKFNTPPASGEVLTYSGKTSCIPKDENFVVTLTTSLSYVDPTL